MLKTHSSSADLSFCYLLNESGSFLSEACRCFCSHVAALCDDRITVSYSFHLPITQAVSIMALVALKWIYSTHSKGLLTGIVLKFGCRLSLYLSSFKFVSK